jgi:hypothetical protein
MGLEDETEFSIMEVDSGIGGSVIDADRYF